MALTILLIVVICLALGGALAVWIVQNAISRQQPAASGGGPAVMELRDAGPEAPAAAPGPAQATTPAEGHSVVFEALATNGAVKAMNITHSIGYDIRQEAGAPLPWRKETRLEAIDRMSLWVQNAGTTGSITCRIIVDGQTVREETTSIPYGVCRVAADRP